LFTIGAFIQTYDFFFAFDDGLQLAKLLLPGAMLYPIADGVVVVGA